MERRFTSMTDKIDCIVIGAGIVGLAAARRVAMSGREVAVLEAEPELLSHTSSRSSEVIHAGIYYPRDSLKARLCVEGKALLYAYCETRRVPARRIGKLIVATSDAESAVLERYLSQATANGVADLTWQTRDDVAKLEPAIVCERALLSPSTGILDTHEYAMSLIADIEAHGGSIVRSSPVNAVSRTSGGYRVEVDEFTLECDALINSAGLRAVEVAARIDGLEAEHVPRAYFAKGHYFTMTGKSPFSRLIYPIAHGGGLGVHVTLDMGGRVRFGPDVTWVDGIDYAFDESRAEAFADAIVRYFPTLDAARLIPGYTGIRPKIAGPGEPAADFVIQGTETHGCDGLVNLFGIESPGITASLAIANEAFDRLYA